MRYIPKVVREIILINLTDPISKLPKRRKREIDAARQMILLSSVAKRRNPTALQEKILNSKRSGLFEKIFIG